MSYRRLGKSYTDSLNHLCNVLPIELIDKNLIKYLYKYPIFKQRYLEFIYNNVIKQINNDFSKNSSRQYYNYWR